MALPIWGIFMKKCYADESLDVSDGQFKKPKDISIETDCAKYKQGQQQEDPIDDEFDFIP